MYVLNIMNDILDFTIPLKSALFTKKSKREFDGNWFHNNRYYWRFMTKRHTKTYSVAQTRRRRIRI